MMMMCVCVVVVYEDVSVSLTDRFAFFSVDMYDLIRITYRQKKGHNQDGWNFKFSLVNFFQKFKKKRPYLNIQIFWQES